MALSPGPFPRWTITQQQLQPGDVLLSCGAEALSQLICKVDGGWYSHAAVWDGNKVVEATDNGVERRVLADDMKQQWYIDAYRWHRLPPGGEVLGHPTYPWAPPVKNEVDDIVTQRPNFAYDELVMSALVIWISKLPQKRWLRIAVRLLLGKVEAWLHDRVFTQPGKHSMVCTEVATTSFWKAKTSPDYAIYVLVDGTRDSKSITAVVPPPLAPGGPGAVPPRPDSPDERIKWRYGQLYLKSSAGMDPQQLADFARAHAQARRGPALRLQAGGPSLPPGCVTPRDLQRSPSLDFVGRISEESGPVVSGTIPGILLSLVWDAVKRRVKCCFGNFWRT